MNKYEFDQKELERHGIRFETVEEGKLFSDIVRKELEVSVGKMLIKKTWMILNNVKRRKSPKPG